MAKDNMMQMKGIQSSSATKSSVLDFNIPKLSHPANKSTQPTEESSLKPMNDEKAMAKAPKAEKTEAKKTAGDPSIEDRIDHLNAIDTFNPFSTLGDKVGSGVSAVFSKGMEATTTLLGGLVKSVL
ncbi:hypothetical protein GCM10011391_22850 [Pullulanibacillus camelliae]|uniref:Uncharacterized protein n=2 Tax=Pullulanibacillus camelliae TaxID=1707096 RepID=A0A8J2YHM0_9BACL|nr:hypothetical protein GCM10011391_22850 [Pullulanibacillus camelliae]